MTQSRETLSKWLQHNRSNFSNFLGKTDTDFTDLLNNSKSDITSLKNQYGELLKLKEPVTYWKERATELNKKANNILWIIVGLSVFIAFLVYLLLWFTPEGLLDSLFGGDKTKAIRWSFVFVVFISIFFVVIRALLKYMFSNFHLARDAEEREKLTYLFISLRDNNEVSEEEKKIVFQALFSRSDTGLLKEDSSPTMPGVTSIIDKIK
jgi:magnesium-transporting ATPase (P-type)